MSQAGFIYDWDCGDAEEIDLAIEISVRDDALFLRKSKKEQIKVLLKIFTKFMYCYIREEQ